jgi:hypothetical protein
MNVLNDNAGLLLQLGDDSRPYETQELTPFVGHRTVASEHSREEPHFNEQVLHHSSAVKRGLFVTKRRLEVPFWLVLILVVFVMVFVRAHPALLRERQPRSLKRQP